MNKNDFSFDLPEQLIAQTPILDRASSRLMVLDKKSGDIAHKTFKNIVDYINKGDCLVINNTKVIPARLYGHRELTGGKIEVLLLSRKDESRWEVLVKPGRKAREGDNIVFLEGILKGKIIKVLENGNRIIEFEYKGIFEEVLDKLGEMPLPHYITERLDDRDRYQTVYAKESGSVAAPTAGLHLTKDLLKCLEEKGVKIAYVTLHVGIGTFRPVKAENILDHEMHSEFYTIEKSQCKIINDTKKEGGRIIAVGTTSCRTLESCTDLNGELQYGSGYTDIFIYPSYKFKIVDSLITNFHLSESTLIMLVCALSNREYVLKAYNTAILEKYRFFSFGDAMLIN